MNAGLDFETKIVVKQDAADRLRDELAEPSWQAETIAISGVTDCYQPAERQLRITRGCLEVLAETRQPFGLITKNALVLRDLDLLGPLGQNKLAHVYLSVTTLDADLARSLEPRTATPAARLDAVAKLSAEGVPVGVMVAPVIPGLNDRELPAILDAARQAGARTAGYTLLRLPLTVRPVFEDWLARNRPLAAERILALIRDTRGGRMNDSQFGRRLSGRGAYAQQIAETFKVFARRHGLHERLPPLDRSQFRAPRPISGQLRLF
jgi:DNA repair photolyase